MNVLKTADLAKRPDTFFRGLKPAEKLYKVPVDGHGLNLYVYPDGRKFWRQRFRAPQTGKESLLSFGEYPLVSLFAARKQAMEARELLAEGKNPAALRKAERAANRKALPAECFQKIALEWHAIGEGGHNEKYWKQCLERLEKDIFPFIGRRSIAELSHETQTFLKLLRRIEERGALVTRARVQNLCSRIMDYACNTGRIDNNPLRPLQRGVFKTAEEKHFAAITDIHQVGKMLQTLDLFHGTAIVRAALKLAPYVFVRPTELRHARWEDIDLDKAEWRFPAAKVHTDHIVPLSRQVVALLREELLPLTGKIDANGKATGWVFPSQGRGKGKHHPVMSENTVNGALHLLGIPNMTHHGFRAMARTILEEEFDEDAKFIEKQLAHAVKDPNGEAYNRTKFLEQRRYMMQLWADCLDALRDGAEVENVKAMARKRNKSRENGTPTRIKAENEMIVLGANQNNFFSGLITP
jgi:integrase